MPSSVTAFRHVVLPMRASGENGGVIVIVRSQAAAESLDGICGSVRFFGSRVFFYTSRPFVEAFVEQNHFSHHYRG